MPLSKKILDEIKKAAGNGNVLTSVEDLYCYGTDSKEGPFLPDLVVIPENSLQISKILKIATRENIPVIPRGAGTGTTGGCVAVSGGIIISLSRMNKILEINRNDFYCVVQPGVFTGDLQREVEKKGMMYPPDPASSEFCTIGGNLGECAGGPRAVKYGVTRDYVLAVEVVLPTGEIIKTGVKTVKGVVGYDFSRLIVGSEGTLGIITEATLKLVPKPESVKTMVSFFPGMDNAAKTVSRIIQKGIIPRVLEYMDESSIESVKDKVAFDIPEGTAALLIIESDGKQRFIDEQILEISEVCTENGSISNSIAEDEVLKSEIWEIRKSLSSSLFKFGPDKINEDIAVPRSRLPLAVERIKELQVNTGLKMVSFGHAGDGNIHFNIILDKSDKERLKTAKSAVLELFKYVIELDGTLSGEHGVGISKKDYIHMELDSGQRELMKRVKKAFDPSNIMNPGKIL